MEVMALQGKPAMGGMIGMALITSTDQNMDDSGYLVMDKDGNLGHNYVLVYQHHGETITYENLNVFANACGLNYDDGDILREHILGMEKSFPVKLVSFSADGVQYDIFTDAREPYILGTDLPEGVTLSDRDMDSIRSQIDSHLVVLNVFGKLGEIIQDRYNQINYKDKAKQIAEFIAEMTYWNDNGEIVPLTIRALENLLDEVKQNLRVC